MSNLINNSLVSSDDKIYVAGHNGMAGSAIVRLLKKKASEGGSNKILTASRKELDLTDSIAVDCWFSENRPDIVVVAAAKVGGIFANNEYPYDFIAENLKIELNVIESAWKHGVKRLLFLGSSCIYPKKSTQPITEESLLSGALEQTNEWYAIAKIAGIKLCDALRKQHGFDAISLMPTNLYGPGDNYHQQNSHVMAALIRRFSEAQKYKHTKVTCWGSGTPRREFLHVDDLAEAAVHCLQFWDPAGNNAPVNSDGDPLTFLNVGTGVDITINELAKKIGKYCDFPGEIVWDLTKPDGTHQKLLDVSRLKSLGWSSKITLDSGLINTIQEFQREVSQ